MSEAATCQLCGVDLRDHVARVIVVAAGESWTLCRECTPVALDRLGEAQEDVAAALEELWRAHPR